LAVLAKSKCKEECQIQVDLMTDVRPGSQNTNRKLLVLLNVSGVCMHKELLMVLRMAECCMQVMSAVARA
jgi:hypothetical protein